MRNRRPIERWILVGILSLLARAGGAVPVAPGYVIDTIATPGFATGDVLATGGAIFVGIGAFGVGTQSIVRIDSGGSTTIASGFNSLGGFSYDAANDRLIVTDNGLEAGDFVGGGPAATGDTVYAIPDPFSSLGVVPEAVSLELASTGSIPGAAGVLVDPSDPNRVFVTDSFAQQLVAVDALLGSTSVLQSGLGFAAGLAAVGATLFIGDLDTTFFTGTIWTVPLASPGSARTAFLTGLLGEFDLELASSGMLLATASAFLVDSQILEIDPVSGATSVLASGFSFATGLDEEAGTIYVLDGGSLFTLSVPEPSLAVLLAAALAGVARARRRS